MMTKNKIEKRIQSMVEESVAMQLVLVVSTLKDAMQGMGAGSSKTAGGGK